MLFAKEQIADKTKTMIFFLRILLCLAIIFLSSFSPLLSQAANNVGPGNSIDFDSSNDRVNLGPVLNSLTLPVTIMAWVKPNPQTTINPVFSSSSAGSDWHGIWLHVASDRIQAAFADGDGGFGTASRRVKVCNYTNLHNDWFHTTAVITNANDIKLYVNGIELSGSYNGSATQLVNNPTGEADIGYHERGPSSPVVHFNGGIDDVRLWDIALSESQVRDQMCRQVLAAEPGLIAAWDFNEGNANNTINDVKGILNGTRIGGALTELSSAPVGNSSVYFYGSQTSTPLIMQELQKDSVSIQADPGTNGIHLYRVDFPPVNQTGMSLPNGLSHYYGVYSINPNQKFAVDYNLVVPFYSPNIYELAYRNHNASPTWATLPGFFGPSANQSNRGRHEEYVISGSCVGPGILPPTISACDEVQLNLPNSIFSILWSDGDTSRQRTFFQNGTYILTGINQDGCSISDTIIVEVLEADFTAMPDVEVCDSVIVNLDAGLLSINWDNGSSNPQRVIYTAGTYHYEAVDPLTGCTVLDTFIVRPIYSANILTSTLFGTERSYCAGDTLKLNIPSDLDVRLLDGRSFNNYEISATSLYRLSISEACIDTTIFVSYNFYDCGCELFIADAFTPNGDGLNDKIKPMGNCDLNYYHWSIYNRWGILIFETRDSEEYFDGLFNGEPINSSSLIYKIASGNGSIQRSSSGTIQIIR
jgi:gliding motility-associated-like protein